MKHKAPKKPSKPKDFTKQSRKVGTRKVQNNETRATGLGSKRVVMPTQQLTAENDQVSEYLVGLRHYNEKKRLDAAHGLIRIGSDSIPESRLSEVLNSLGYCLCDEDDGVRSKCSNFLFTVLCNTDSSIIAPFIANVCIQIRAGLSSVNAAIRLDSVMLVKRLLPLKIFTPTEIQELLRSLIEIHSTILSMAQSKSKKNQEEARMLVLSAIESLLQLLHWKEKEIEDGLIDPNQWTIASVLVRVFSPSSQASTEVKRLIHLLDRQGDDVYKQRIETLAVQCGLTCISGAKRSDVGSSLVIHKKLGKKPVGSVFSKFSLLTRDDSD